MSCITLTLVLKCLKKDNGFFLWRWTVLNLQCFCSLALWEMKTNDLKLQYLGVLTPKHNTIWIPLHMCNLQWLQHTIYEIIRAAIPGNWSLNVMSELMCTEEINMAFALKDQAVHEKCFNSPDISKSDSCCLHINLPTSIEQCLFLIGRAVWGECNHLQVSQ